MTVPATGVMAGAPAAELGASRDDPRTAQVEAAATQFEALLLRQLVATMRSTLGEGGLFGSGAGSNMYSHLFDQSLSDSMAASGGLGLREVISRSMLGPAYRSQAGQEMNTAPLRPFVPRAVGEPMEVRPASGVPLTGMTGRLQEAARRMLGPSGLAPQWGREGRLTTEDLASDFATEGPRGRAVFNVRDAAGFEDCYKCNLFALELARRSGFMVPLIGRGRGWGYMGPDGVTADAARGQLRGDWGEVVTGESAESLDAGAVRGERAFLLTATGTGDRAGHMGIIERVHSVEYDDAGEIRSITFDGWEGRTYGATHLTDRVWRRGARFDHIEIVELQRPADDGPLERTAHPHANPSVHDLEPAR